MTVTDFIQRILKKELSYFEIVQYIEQNSTINSRNLLLEEIYNQFIDLSSDFMFEVKEEDIIDAINLNIDNLEYLYLDKNDMLKVKHFIRNINNQLTVFNVSGFSKIEDSNKTKVIYLNNLMIDYHDNFFNNGIKGFENISNLRSVCDFLTKHFAKTTPKQSSTIQMNYSNFQNDEKEEILIVEELENTIAIEGVEYKRKIDDEWETYKFDPIYFDTFISGPLYTEFVKSLYDRIKPLNDFEINRYLTLCVNQFKTHTPEKRIEDFKRNYFNTYWYPNYMEYRDETYINKYVTHIWKHYTTHFNIFKEATEGVLSDFKNGLIGSSKIEQVSPKLKLPQIFPQSFKYIHFNTNQDAIVNLMDSLKKNNFIDAQTKLTDFKKIFSGGEINKKISWIGYSSELSHFVKNLIEDKDKIEDLKQKHWKVTKNCFVMADESEISAQKLRHAKEPVRIQLIKNALNNL